MPSRALSFASNAAVISAHSPFVAPALLMPQGTFFGYQISTGRPAYWNLSLLKLIGIIEKTIVDINAGQNHGKSTFAKTQVLRGAGQQAGRNPLTGEGDLRRRREAVFSRRHIDGKSEYAPVMDHLLAPVYDLAKDGAINALDIGMGMDVKDITRSALTCQSDAKEAPLDPIETLVTIILCYYMYERMPHVTSLVTLDGLMQSVALEHAQTFQEGMDLEYRGYLLEKSTTDIVTPQDAAILRAMNRGNLLEDNSMRLLREAAMRCSSYLNILLRSGRFGTLFTGTKGLSQILSEEDIYTFDLTSLPTEAANLFEGFFYQWMQTADAAGLGYMLPDMFVSEEEGTAGQSLTHTLGKDTAFRLSRTVQTEYIDTMQWATDPTSFGEANSQLRKAGQNVAKSYAVHMYGKQPADDDVIHAITKRGATDVDAWRTTQLPQGCWAVQVAGQPMDFLQHVVLPPEHEAIRTNWANERAAERLNAYDLAEVQERLRIAGELRGKAIEAGLTPYTIGSEEES